MLTCETSYGDSNCTTISCRSFKLFRLACFFLRCVRAPPAEASSCGEVATQDGKAGGRKSMEPV